MISKTKLKYIKSLQVKKYRKQEQSFVVEGAKGVQELLKSSFEVTLLCATEQFMDNSPDLPEQTGFEVHTVTERDLEQLGSFQSNNSVIAVARMRPDARPVLGKKEVALVLDDIRDPGNLGTIIRTADWFGLRHIIASPETADFYNPKVIAASMGSFTRVNVHHTDLTDFIRNSGLPVYGTFLDGTNVRNVSLGEGGLIVMGNESNGISPEVERLVTTRITIPRFGKAESLNAAVAAAVVLDNVIARG